MALSCVLNLGFDGRHLVVHSLDEIGHVGVCEQFKRLLLPIGYELAISTLEGPPILNEIGNLRLNAIGQPNTLIGGVLGLAVEKHRAVPLQ
ncbi:hypothetical protein D3C87_1214820 [compost metagenome]